MRPFWLLAIGAMGEGGLTQGMVGAPHIPLGRRGPKLRYWHGIFLKNLDTSAEESSLFILVGQVKSFWGHLDLVKKVTKRGSCANMPI